MTTPQPPAELSWRIPEEHAAQRYRIGTLQVVVATLFFGAIIIGVMPRDLILPGLAATLVVAGLLLARNWLKRGPGRKQPDNVYIDSRGVAWRDESRSEHLFEREKIVAFRIAEGEDTLRPVPALTLLISGGFESQPIELHEPATPDAVRRVLGELGPREESAEAAAMRFAAETIGGVELKSDPEAGVWEFCGARANLLALCDRLAEVAERLSSFPVGARPIVLHIGPTRLQFSPARAADAEVSEQAFHGTREDLVTLAAKLGAALESTTPTAPIEAPVFDDAPDAWRVRLRLDSDSQKDLDRKM